MVCVPKMAVLHSLFALAVGTGSTGQLAAKKGGPVAEAVRTLFSEESNAICGGGQIRKMLTEVPTEASFRCNKWTGIQATAEAFLQKVDVEIGKLTLEIERLEKEIQLALKKSAPNEWDIMGSAKPILEEILTEAFISPETAKQVKCGQEKLQLRRKLGVKATAHRAAKEMMSGKLTPVFQNGDVRVGDKPGDSMNILAMCGNILGWDPAHQDDTSYCDELCAAFAREALDLSSKYAGSYAGKSVKDLEANLEKVKGDLKYNRDEQDECKRAYSALSAFAAQLEQLNKDIEAKHNLRMEAQDNLDQADEELEDMMDQGDNLNAFLAKAAQEYGLATKKANDLSGLANRAKQLEAKRNEEVAAAKKAFAIAAEELSKAHAASISLDEIKGLVTQTMLKMVAHYEVSVVRPVQTLGLKLATDISEYFDGVMSEATTEREAVFSTLKLMDKYCESTASVHFKKIKSVLDLSPLCPKDNAQAVGNQIQTMVSNRAEEVQTALENVRSALDVYKGQEGMTKAESDRLTSLGELEGLREVATVYGKSQYFDKYLQHWKLDAVPPKFLDLIASLKSLVESLTAAENQMRSALQDAIRAAQEQNDARRTAVDMLKEALKANEVAKAKEAAIQADVSAQEKQIEDKESDLRRLQEAFDAAMKAYKDAKELLVTTHLTGTNLQ